MRWLHHRIVKAFLISSVVGCGFSPGMPGESLTGAGGSGTSSGSGGASSGSGGVGLSSGSGGSGGGGGDVGIGTGGAPCGQGSVPVMPEPPDILIVQDKSLSMSMDPSGANCAAN